MYRLSYRDLQWRTFFLQPEFHTMENGVQTGWKASEDPHDMIVFRPDYRTAVIGMPEGSGKISDAGYDQTACLLTRIPAWDHVIFRGSIRVLQLPPAGKRNSQEGLGLFIRDTLAPDEKTGYPYSNMAACGIYRGKYSLFGREGITENSIEQVRSFTVSEGPVLPASFAGKKLFITLEKKGDRLNAEISAEGEEEAVRLKTEIDGKNFSSREADSLYLGFLSARGCRIEADLKSVSVAYSAGAEVKQEYPPLYVSPEGSNHGEGTKASPLALQAAIDRCECGQEIKVLPGRYLLTKDLVIRQQNSGKSGSLSKITGSSGTGMQPVLDFQSSRHGFRIEGSYWDIGGLAVTGGHGFKIQGSCNRIHHCQAVSNLETGFLIRHPSIDSDKDSWPSFNTISDCISCLNRDGPEQNADGFACKIAAGGGNSFIRCTAWMNSDDGFDLFSKNRSTGAVRLTDCGSFLNGYVPENGRLKVTAGNGSGFKLGGSGMPADHEAVRCKAFGNRGFGFTSNSNPRMRLSGCLAGNNEKNYVYYFAGPRTQAKSLFEDCREENIPDFDPACWAKAHLPAEGILSIRQFNDLILQNALERLPSAGKDAGFENTGILMMCSSLYGGGAERVACRLASAFAEKYRVYCLYIQDKGETYPLHPDVKVIAMPAFLGAWQEKTEYRITFTRELKRRLKIQTAVSFMFTMNKINVLSKGTENTICSERNNPAKRDPEHLQEIEGIYEAADHVVFQSAAVRDLFSEKVKAHSSIILNPTEVDDKRTKSRHRIVNVGRLVPQKNQALLIRAFAAFYRTHPQYTLSFYGAGELAEELQDLAEKLGIGQAVQFHGYIREIHAAIADAELFVLSSDYEGLSNALLESMIMGLPCISTRCEGAVDMIQSGENGLLTDVGNEEQLTAAMTLLADDSSLRERLGQNAGRIAEQVRTRVIISRWEELL